MANWLSYALVVVGPLFAMRCSAITYHGHTYSCPRLNCLENMPYKFDPPYAQWNQSACVPQPAVFPPFGGRNIGGWCKTYGDVSCLLADIDMKGKVMKNGVLVPEWKLPDHCDQINLSGELKVTQLPRAGARIISAIGEDAGAQALQTALTNHQKLEQVSIINNRLNPVSANVIAAVIRGERDLGLQGIVRTNKIRKWFLARNRFQASGTKIICDAITYMQGNARGSLAFLRKERKTNIKVQFIGGVKKETPIIGYGGVEELILDSNVIGDAGAKHVAKMLKDTNQFGTLRILSLRSNRITDVGAQALYDAIGEFKNCGNDYTCTRKDHLDIREMPLDGNPISPGLRAKIARRLELKCCDELYYTMLNSEEDRGCTTVKAQDEAKLIRVHYESYGMCCRRLGYSRCA